MWAYLSSCTCERLFCNLQKLTMKDFVIQWNCIVMMSILSKSWKCEQHQKRCSGSIPCTYLNTSLRERSVNVATFTWTDTSQCIETHKDDKYLRLKVFYFMHIPISHSSVGTSLASYSESPVFELSPRFMTVFFSSYQANTEMVPWTTSFPSLTRLNQILQEAISFYAIRYVLFVVVQKLGVCILRLGFI